MLYYMSLDKDGMEIAEAFIYKVVILVITVYIWVAVTPKMSVCGA